MQHKGVDDLLGLQIVVRAQLARNNAWAAQETADMAVAKATEQVDAAEASNCRFEAPAATPSQPPVAACSCLPVAAVPATPVDPVRQGDVPAPPLRILPAPSVRLHHHSTCR